VEQYIDEQGIGPKNLPVVTGHTPEEAGHELIYHALISLGNEIKMLRDLIIANLPASPAYETDEREDMGASFQPSGSVSDMEKELIAMILKQTRGNRREAARKLGIGERTLYRKLKKYSLN
jgi:DNA-binding NtrC family response regulator